METGSRYKIDIGRLLVATGVLSVLIFLVAPAFIVIPMSFGAAEYLIFPPKSFSVKWYIEFFKDDRWWGSLWFSLQVASITTLFATVIGTMASLALVRGNFLGKRIINTVIISPMIVPVIIIAISIYGLFAELGLIGTRIGIVLAHTVLAVPYVVLIMSASLYNFDFTYEMAAMNLGANRIMSFFHVTLPLLAPAIVTSAVFAFIVSFDELVIANFITGVHTSTLPKQMFDGIRLELNPIVASASSMLILFSIFTIILLSVLKKK